MSTSNQSRPRRAARVRYNEDSDSVDLSDFETRPQPQRAVRRRIQTYREQSSDEDTTETSSDESDSLSEEVLPQQGTRSRPKRIHKPSTRPQKRKPQKAGTRTVANPFSAYKRQKTRSHDVNHSKAKDAITISLPPNGRIPPWQQLPYQILVSIMRYAAYPLYESRSRPTASIHWLCSLSRLCRSFHDACTAALLHNPPLYPDVRAYGLIHLLQQDPGRLMTNYRRKIHYLDIEVKHLLARKSGIALADLISNTPLLQGMRLYSTYDDWRTEVWAQPGVRKIHWSYPPELFDLLDDNNVILKQFEWNGRFPSPTEVLETTLAAHSRPAFSRLQELSLLNLTPPDKSSDAEIAKFQSMFTSAFEHLTGLKRLSLINCGCLDESTTPMLPVGLEYLEIDNCSKLTSTALEQYLQVGGSTIRTLKLCDNQSMSLGFMADVKSMCPRLQDIDVDMLYVDPTSYRDRDPLYDELLPNGPPTWPSSLVNVSFENMRQLSAEDAEDFFDSLVESSRHLPRLKRLNIKAILKNASWRDRAQLRKMWLPKLQNVFLNRSKPSGPAPVSAAGGHTKRASVSQRQSSRIAESLKRMSTGDDTGDSDAASSSLAIQGRCDVVNLQISDQRPAQDQFREDDFLDDEPSDDEEWMGVDREPVSTGYAW